MIDPSSAPSSSRFCIQNVIYFFFPLYHVFFCCLKGEGGEILSSGSSNMLIPPQSYEYKHTSYLNTVIFWSSAASISTKTEHLENQSALTASTFSPHSHFLPTALCSLIHSTIYMLWKLYPSCSTPGRCGQMAMPSPPNSLSRVNFILGDTGCLFLIPSSSKL